MIVKTTADRSTNKDVHSFRFIVRLSTFIQIQVSLQRFCCLKLWKRDLQEESWENFCDRFERRKPNIGKTSFRRRFCELIMRHLNLFLQHFYALALNEHCGMIECSFRGTNIGVGLCGLSWECVENFACEKACDINIMHSRVQWAVNDINIIHSRVQWADEIYIWHSPNHPLSQPITIERPQ